MNQDNDEMDSLRRQVEEADRRAAEERRQRIEAQQLLAGTYYTTFDQLWQRKGQSFNSSHFTRFIRSKPPMFLESAGKGKLKHNSFLETIEAANKSVNMVKDDANSARTSHRDTLVKKQIWSCNILHIPPIPIQTRSTSGFHDPQVPELPRVPQNDSNDANFIAPDAPHPVYTETDDGTDETSSDSDDDDGVLGEIAHLVPASPLYSSLYFDVAKWVFGKDYARNDVSYRAIQKLIHGATAGGTKVEEADSAAEDMKAQSGVATIATKKRETVGSEPAGKKKSAGGKEPAGKKKSEDDEEPAGEKKHSRLPHTGIKHMVCNKIRLADQAERFDKKAQVLIVPILTVEEACAWNGGSYSAIFIIAAKKRASLKVVAADTHFQEIIDQASEDEIEKARQLLAAIVKGLAYSLTNMNSETAPFLQQSHLTLVDKFQKMLVPTGGVIVPSKKAPLESTRVAKITFWAQGSTRGGHPAPDPILLATKAGVNWSKFFGFQLLPTGEPEEEVDSDDESAIAEWAYVGWAKECEQKQQQMDILGMTISANGH